jgi:AbiV family abortive infection protein
MVRHNAQPPERGNLLFENLFVRRSGNDTLEAVSGGLIAVLRNASRLIQDVELLVDHKRYASAGFLLATADEEMAKSYILIDACRLDFCKHHSVLKGLCKAFYNHVFKHAYNEVIRSPNLREMLQVKELWDAEIIRWWPSSDPESGEPDMPHDTYFFREMPLYVDFIDYDQEWFTPEKETQRLIFEDTVGYNALCESRNALDRLWRTFEAGLYRADCLSILNKVFRRHYITEATDTKAINRLWENAEQQMESTLGIEREIFRSSALKEVPLYHFLSSGAYA